MRRLGDDEYDMEETPNGAYVEYSDYKELEIQYLALQQTYRNLFDDHKSLVKRYSILYRNVDRVTDSHNISPNLFYDPHD